jgi:SSS family solute:Na+ symporter
VKFGFIDGSIVGLYLLGTIIVGLAVRRSVRRVDDFLLAGREMDLYVGVASLAATEFGIITCVYTGELGYKFGFAGAAPGILAAIAMAVVGLTGFCIKPLREAGVITIPELLERQFGPRIRILSGIIIVLGGLLNMGLFLRMGGEFLVTVAGLKPSRLEITMTAILVIVLIYTILGGMLSVLVTDFLQFLVMSLGLLAVTLLVLDKIGWESIILAAQNNHGSGAFNPFANKSLGAGWVMYNGLVALAAVITAQTMIARVLAAKDSRTGRRIYTVTSFFFVCRFILPGLWGMAALAVIGPSMLSEGSIKAMPTFLAAFVPSGLLGILIAAMLAADMSTDSSYMLTWSSIIYNDILAPFRRNRTEAQGLLWNRLILSVIGIFLLFYGLWYPLKGPLWNYLTITATINLSSISVMLIACCYWHRASTLGATLAILLGASSPIGFLIFQQLEGFARWHRMITTELAGLASFILAAMGMIVGTLIAPSRQGDPR